MQHLQRLATNRIELVIDVLRTSDLIDSIGLSYLVDYSRGYEIIAYLVDSKRGGGGERQGASAPGTADPAVEYDHSRICLTQHSTLMC